MSKKGSDRRQRRKPRRYSPRILVVGEGKRTEYNYFATFAPHFKRANGPAIVPRQPRQTGSPVTIVREAIRIRENDKDFDARQGDRCYCLLDVEPHDTEKAPLLNEALELAEQKGIRILLSNPSFEFWLLCHVANASSLKSSLADPQAADKALRGILGVGKRELNADESRFHKLVDRARTAASAAREIHCQHHAAVPDIRRANPSTTVYLLVEYLLGASETPP